MSNTSANRFYKTVLGIQNLSPVDLIGRANELVDLAENPPQDMKDTYYPNFSALMDRWIQGAELKFRDNATADDDKVKINAIINDLKDGRDNYISLYAKKARNSADATTRPKVFRVIKIIKKKKVTTDPKDSEGETYTVKKTQTNVEPQETKTNEQVKEEFDAMSGQSSRTIKLQQMIEKGLDMPGGVSVEQYIQKADQQQLNQELIEIEEAVQAIEVAKLDLRSIKPEMAKDLDRQKADLLNIRSQIENSDKWKGNVPLPPGAPPSLDLPKIPEAVKAEKPPTPTGEVKDTVTGYASNNPLVLEAREYIRKIKQVPQNQLPIQVNELLVNLQKAISMKNLEVLEQSLVQTRNFFSSVDANLNNIIDDKERQGEAIDAGLEDFKKIEKEKTAMKNNKPKLEELRTDPEKGEEERIKKNFNKDVLELTKANDVLKSKVNIQSEEIKILKETIETKLKKENDEMLKGVAPVFHQYLQLDISNVFQENEMNEEVYYSVL